MDFDSILLLLQSELDALDILTANSSSLWVQCNNDVLAIMAVVLYYIVVIGLIKVLNVLS